VTAGEAPRRCSGDEQVGGEALGSRWEQQAGGNRTRRGLDSDEVRDFNKSRIYVRTYPSAKNHRFRIPYMVLLLI
jgi:hypothetical protein